MEQDKQTANAIAVLFEVTALLINDAVIEARDDDHRRVELEEARHRLEEAKYAFRN